MEIGKPILYFRQTYHLFTQPRIYKPQVLMKYIITSLSPEDISRLIVYRNQNLCGLAGYGRHVVNCS